MQRNRIKSRLSQNDGLLIAPLLDIIFLVLIFFLVNVNYKGIQSFDMQLPTASEPDNKQPSSRIVVSIMSGKYLINETEVTLATFRAVLKDEMSKNKTTHVLILGGEDIPYKSLIDIIDMVKISGASGISLGVDEKKL